VSNINREKEMRKKLLLTNKTSSNTDKTVVNLRNELARAKEQLKQSESKEMIYTEQLAEKQREISRLKVALQEAESRGSDYGKLKKNDKDQKRKIKELTEQLAKSESNVGSPARTNTAEDNQAAEAGLAKLKQKITNAEEKFGQVRQLFGGLKESAALQKANTSNTLQTVKAEIEERMEDVKSISLICARATLRLEALSSQVSNSTANSSQYLNNINTVTETVDAFHGSLKSLDKEMTSGAGVAVLLEKIESGKTQVRELKRRLKECAKNLKKEERLRKEQGDILAELTQMKKLMKQQRSRSRSRSRTSRSRSNSRSRSRSRSSRKVD